MVIRYGMFEGLGDVTYEEEPTPFLGQPAGNSGWQPRRYSDETTREIVNAARSRATGILERYRRQLKDGTARYSKRELWPRTNCRRSCRPKNTTITAKRPADRATRRGAVGA